MCLYPVEEFDSLEFGNLSVRSEGGSYQVFLKVDSCNFLYTQLQYDDIPSVQTYYDNVDGYLPCIMNVTFFIRLLIHVLVEGTIPPNLDKLDTDLHQQILLFEVQQLKGLVNFSRLINK